MEKISERGNKVQPSATLSLNAKAIEMKKSGLDIVSFTAGEPDSPTPQNIQDAAVAAMKAGHTRYTKSTGIVELREAICAKFKRDNNLEYSPNEVIVSNGAKHSIHNVLQAVLNEGDEVLVPIPSWVSYFEMVKLSGGVPVSVPSDENYCITADALREKITDKTKLIMINSPANPTGGVLTKEELQKIADLVVEKDLLIMSDEIYEYIVFGSEHVSIASLGEEIKQRTLVINGVSKAYAMTGWRLGYCAGPQEIIKTMGKIQSQATSSPNALSQWAAVEALNGPQDSVETMRVSFEKRRDLMVERLNAIPGVTCNTPGGAFYVFPDISQCGLGSMEFSKRLLEEKHVATIPGMPFGMDGNIRLSYAVSVDEINKGLDRIEEFCKSLQ